MSSTDRTLDTERTVNRARILRWGSAVLVLLVWMVGFVTLRGRDTMALAQADLTPLHERLNGLNDAVSAGRSTNPLFIYFFDVIRAVIDAMATAVQAFIAQPAFGRPVPLIGWLGVVAVATFLAWAFGNVKVALLTAAGLAGFWLFYRSVDFFDRI